MVGSTDVARVFEVAEDGEVLAGVCAVVGGVVVKGVGRGVVAGGSIVGNGGNTGSGGNPSGTSSSHSSSQSP